MVGLRPYLSVVLLLLAAVMALPKSWVHACEPDEVEQVAWSHGNDGDAVSHAACAFCDQVVVGDQTPSLSIPGMVPQLGSHVCPAIGGAPLLPTVSADCERGPPVA